MRVVIGRLFGIFAVSTILALHAVPSLAQPFGLTIVKSDGDDAASCVNFADRCATIQKGIINVSPGGTVVSLDSGFSGLININKPFTLLGEGGGSTVFGSVGGAGILINLPSGNDILTLRGIGVDQRDNPFHGITFAGTGIFHLQNCFLRGSGNGYGINFTPNGTAELYISNCVIADNGLGAATGGGIFIKPSGAASVKVVLDNVVVENNFTGITIDARNTTGSSSVTIRNSTVSGGSQFGIYALESGGGVTNVVVEGSTSANNATFGIGSNGVNSFVRVRNSTVTGNATGIAVAGSGKLISMGGNSVRANTANGAFTATEAQQ
jgi:hypothetical protein